MRHRLAVLLAAGAIAAVPAGSSPVAHADSAAVAHAACTKARIGGKTKCIARGQFCARRYQRDYKRYGFSCSKRDANGRYHLQ